MPTTDVVTRIYEWLESLVSDPRAAAEFAESPAISLASHDLSQSDLDGVDLRSVAGGLGGSAGISAGGRQTLTQFSNSAPSHHHPVQEVAFVTREVHHNNPIVQKTFIDNSQTFNIDNSFTLNNNGGVINGDVTVDNDVTLATGKGAVAIAEGADGNVVATGAGAVAAGDDAGVAGPGAVLAQGSSFDGPFANNSDGAILADEIGAANSGNVDGGILGGSNVEDSVSGQGNVGISPDSGGGPEEGKPEEGKPEEGKPEQAKAEDGKAEDGKAEDGEQPEPAFGQGAPEGHHGQQPEQPAQPADQPQEGDGVPDGPANISGENGPESSAAEPELPEGQEGTGVPKVDLADDAEHPDGVDDLLDA